MYKRYLLFVTFLAPITCLADVSYNLCNKHGVSDVSIVAKDKKNSMAIIYNGSVSKVKCVSVASSTGGGDHGEIELKVGQGIPYGVPWIKSGDDVNF